MNIDPTKSINPVKLSILIPLDKPTDHSLRPQLEALGRQTVRALDFEVILVNPKPEREIDPRAWVGLSFACRLISPPYASSSEALNRAVREARGETCLFLAMGALPEPEFAAGHLRAQAAEGGILGAGRMVYAASPRSGWHARQSAIWKNQQQEAIDQGQRYPDWLDCRLENLSVQRRAILAAGGFDSVLAVGAGPDLAFRLFQQGFRRSNISDATATLEEGCSINELAASTADWGADSVRMWRKHPSMLPALLGGFYRSSPRGVLLRRLLLELNLPSGLYAPIGRLLPGNTAIEKYFEFLMDLWFWGGVRRAIPDRQTWSRLTQGVIILMYHAFGENGEPASRYVLPQKAFVQQMKWLKRLGYRAIRIEKYLCCLRDFQLPPEKSIVITMDDGYLDNYRLAYPILRQAGFPATIFLITRAMGKTNTWDSQAELTGRPVISWEQAREMLAGGLSFGAHTRTHPFLTDLSPEQAWQEIKGSQEDLEAELGAGALAFAYPHGVSTSETQALVERAGLLGAATTQVGVNTPAAPSFALPRVEVRGTFSLLKFLSLLWNTVDAR